MNNLTKLARVLKRNSTKQEKILWKLLRNNNLKNYKFKRQYQIGGNIVDFICREKWLIIELDGGQHNELKSKEYDLKRTQYLESRGFKVLRIWNNDIDLNISGVYEEIMRNPV